MNGFARFTDSSFILHHSSFAPSLFFFDVVGHSETRTGGGVHLFGGVDGVLQFGDSIFDLRQLFFDLFLQFTDFLFGDLLRRLVELALLIGQDRHRARDYSLKSTGTVVHDLTRTPSFIGGENVD